MFSDDDLLPISALQHLLFCERQCALIHLERVWAENRLTVEGRHLHRRAHDAKSQWQHGVRVTRGLLLRSFQFGLFGQADVVEFEPLAGRRANWNGSLADVVDWQDWRITPVEYKRGKPKTGDCDRVQLCAQALCLEEMLAVAIPFGGLFYGRRKRRTVVNFDSALRASTVETARRLHAMIASGRTPPAVKEPKCDRCSLIGICLPDALARTRNAADYFRRTVDAQLLAVAPASDEELLGNTP
jgi:CRISPR-associated exonuclease Cas4